MKKLRPARLDRLSLNRETLHLLEPRQLEPAAGGVTRPGASCYPVVCFTTTVASSCC